MNLPSPFHRHDNSPTVCHSERSEESMCGVPAKAWILHFVQNDKPRVISSAAQNPRQRTFEIYGRVDSALVMNSPVCHCEGAKPTAAAEAGALVAIQAGLLRR